MFQSVYLNPLPPSLISTAAKWAWVSFTAFANLPGHFNRSIFDSPWETETDNSTLSKTLNYVNTTDFVAYDKRFLEIIGVDATIEHVQPLAFQSHEAPCYIPDTRQLLFVEWGKPDGDDGIHSWQYLLDVENNTLRKITTDPPTYNVHACVNFQGQLYGVTDGYGDSETGSLVQIDPQSWKATTLLNNFLGQPFGGFNDLEVDPEGNFWLTDSKSGWGRGIVDFAPPNDPSIYFVNKTTMQPKIIWTTTGNANGVAMSPDSKTLYIPDTGVSEFRPSNKNPHGRRMLWAFDVGSQGGVLANQRLLTSPISYFYDGLRVSREGWLFSGSGDGVDVIDPVSGFVLGSIRTGGGENVAVSMAFGEHEMWIVGKGGAWHVKDIKAKLKRDW
ncbi:hypothetical protein N7532_004185 [Penicillium argentinense]|uniref:SMP-30/Gluconolactonase/LRE-like region domain-containing protein n=1 Tax=Penicillium argentinense TaxID=1131581 RepID=A0A9W9FNS6_9EURO|nr:uncharacterized protein N7532_004185 [Penicillium argentinense]KAJ5103656.1 hypothetical protein N7532_004185 [Penicillium argentinense]